MNKQEAIEKLQGLKQVVEEGDKGSYNKGLINALTYALNVTKQLDEPEKPVLSKAEDEWLTRVKKAYLSQSDRLHIITRQDWGYDFEVTMYNKEYKLSYEPYKLKGESLKHVKERFINAILYGYEVEKEKLYYVEIPSNSKGYYYALARNHEGTTILVRYDNTMWKALPNTKLTESEIKKDFEWAWKFAEEVKE